MTEPIDQPEYEVGYKRPPAATQFKPGQSGNRKGRPKGAQNFSTALEKELKARVPITENGKRKQVPKREVIAKQLANKAAAGDLKAASLLLAREARGQEVAASASSPMPDSSSFTSADQRTLDSIVARLRQSVPTEVSSPTSMVVASESRAHMGDLFEGYGDQDQPTGAGV